jgi:hypothetical protein
MISSSKRKAETCFSRLVGGQFHGGARPLVRILLRD